MRLGLLVCLWLLMCVVTWTDEAQPQVIVGRDCQISWDVPVWPDGSAVVDLFVYRIYVRQISGVYNFKKASAQVKVDETRHINCRRAGIQVDGGYAVVITAVNRSGAESVASEEKTITRDTRPPPSPPGLTVIDQKPAE